MVVVAIAGGTGGVGRTVSDAIMEAGEHKAIVLSRTVSLAYSIAGDAAILNLCRQQLLPQPTNQNVLPLIITIRSI